MSWAIANPSSDRPRGNRRSEALALATLAGLSKLESWGVTVLPGESGHQACGETGAGRLLDPDALVARIQEAL